MTRLQKFWDFVFGATLIGGAPVVVFVGLTIVSVPLLELLVGRRDWMAFFALVLLALAIGAFGLACAWRRKHRRLPISTFFVEMLIGALFGALFIFIFAARGVAGFLAN